MGLKVCNLFSGSTGNCTFVSGGQTNILVDAGAMPTRIERALRVLGVNADALSILITHRHSDHISGLAAFIKRHPAVCVYADADTAAYLDATLPPANIRVFSTVDFYLGDLTVTPVPLSHDVPCVGFCFTCGGKKAAYFTDTGYFPLAALEAARDADLVLIECNHSPDLLLSNDKYPPVLKRRILGKKGHLSNEACAEAVVTLCRAGVKHFMLGHLSQENNYPELAERAVREALEREGLQAGLTLTFPDRLSELMEIV